MPLRRAILRAAGPPAVPAILLCNAFELRLRGMPSSDPAFAIERFRSASMLVVRAALALVACALPLGGASCAEGSPGDTPERVVQQVIDRMQQVHGDVDKASAAYELFAADARRNLAERAERASAAAGRVVRPEEMLAPSRFHLGFQPRSWSTRRGARWAIVTVEGKGPRQRREVRLVREEGQWRVVLDLPELPPVQHRAREGR